MYSIFVRLKKIFVKFITDIFLPFKSQKNIKKYVRKVLIDGSFSSLIKTLLHKKEWNNQANFKYYLSLVLCIKDEADYILEWIEYYLLQGVNHFYIYNNNGTDNTEELLKPYIDKGIVTWHVYPGKSKQKEIYNDALEKYRLETHWMGFLDVDEFIVSPQYKNLADILKNYEAYSQLFIAWICYGTSYREKKSDGLVIERFTMHQTGVSRTGKAIINPRKTISADIHFHVVLGQSVDENKITLYGGYPKEPTANILRINHYCTKSMEECMIKRKRGGSSHPSTDYMKDDWLEKHNRNDVTDDIMLPYIPILRDRLQKK